MLKVERLEIRGHSNHKKPYFASKVEHAEPGGVVRGGSKGSHETK